jgi:integrase
MTLPNQVHIQKRGSTYYYRRRIPLDLLAHYYPKKELIFSLGTPDYREAERLARAESVKYDTEFERIRFTLNTPQLDSISPEDINKLSQAWKAHLLEEDEEARIEGLSDGEYNSLDESYDIVEAAGKDAFARGQYEQIEFEMTDFCESNGYRISRDTEGYLRLANAFLRTSLEVTTLLKQRHKGEIIDTPFAPLLTPKVSTASPMDSLEALRDYWLTQDKRSRTAQASAATIIRKLREYVGDLRPSEITKAHIVELKDKMLAAGSSPATINKDRGILAAIFSCAEKNAKIQQNPFKDMKKLKIRKNSVDKNFTPEELNTIFSSPIFTKNERPKGGKGEAAYWMPLLGLYTACRLNELAQLFVEDVGIEDTIHYLVIRPDDDTNRSVKDSNKRRVPIHPALLALGFMQYVAEVKAQGHRQLFPALKVTRAGGKLGDAWGRWWSAYVRDTLGIARVPSPFHAFRHTFAHEGRRCRMSYEVRMRIEGHALGTVGDKEYGGSMFPLEPMYEELKNLEFKGFSLNSIIKI